VYHGILASSLVPCVEIKTSDRKRQEEKNETVHGEDDAIEMVSHNLSAVVRFRDVIELGLCILHHLLLGLSKTHNASFARFDTTLNIPVLVVIEATVIREHGVFGLLYPFAERRPENPKEQEACGDDCNDGNNDVDHGLGAS
jgi:hypothetical protein